MARNKCDTFSIGCLLATVFLFVSRTNAQSGIRLAGSSVPGAGRLEVLHNGVWGTVCDDGFDNNNNAVMVACYMLGYGRVGRFMKNQYGSGSDTIWLDDVRCTGSELTLDACVHNAWGSHNCIHCEDVSISCRVSATPTAPFKITTRRRGTTTTTTPPPTTTTQTTTSTSIATTSTTSSSSTTTTTPITTTITPTTATCSNQLVQQNVDGSNFFNRTWNEFKAGFGNVSGNYWIGNELLHVLTQSGKYKLRFDLQSRDNLQWYWAEFSAFTVDSESDDYTLHVSGLTGNVVHSNFYGFEYHNGMKFNTKDRDNDADPNVLVNCAVILGGGFWYNACSACNINTLEGNGNHFAWYLLSSSQYLLKTCRMSLVCV